MSEVVHKTADVFAGKRAWHIRAASYRRGNADGHCGSRICHVEDVVETAVFLAPFNTNALTGQLTFSVMDGL